MSDLSFFKLDTQTINIKDTTAREAADSAKNRINELESEKADAIISSTSGAIASFQDGAESTAKELVVAIKPVQEGTGDPSPDNVRPISGWTGAKVTRTGKNLLDIDRYGVRLPMTMNGITWTKVRDGVYHVQGTATSTSFLDISFNSPTNAMPCISFRGYRLFLSVTNPTVLVASGYFRRDGSVTQLSNGSVIPDEAVALRVYLKINPGITIDADFSVQLELGSTATAYEPYQGETCEVEFPTEAGTVYGGSLDVTTGVLTVDMAQIANYNGETLPGKWISDIDVYAAGASPTTGAQVVYELATPVTYQLTPQEITTLLGQNNIWADTGDMSVTYRADTKLYIDKKFTELQALILEKGETDYDSTTKENMTITTDTHSVA